MNLITIHGVRGRINAEGTAELNLEDISRGLGFTQQKNGTEYIRWETVYGHLTDIGFSQQVGKDGYVPENIFYRLAMKAKNEVAESFQVKVADEILPSIRKHGAYMTPQTLEAALDNPETMITVLQRLKKEQDEKALLQAKIEADKPLVLFAESLQVSHDSILIADLAKLLRQNGFHIGEIRLFQWLRENGYLIKTGSERNQPTQRSMELGIMEVKMGSRSSSDGTVKLTRTTKITGKGQVYFINKFKSQTA